MPLYEYRCAGCDHEFEVLVGVRDADQAECPACGSAPARRLFSVIAAVRPDANPVRGGDGASAGGGCCGGACGHC